MNLIALHGFWGQGSNWNILNPCLENTRYKLIAPDLHKYEKLSPRHNFSEWTKNFLDFAKSFSTPRVLLGYSMGGRLALHAVKENPSLFDKLIIVSSHPGLISEFDKIERIKSDSAWKMRFESEDLNKLAKEWDQQNVLLSSKVSSEKDLSASPEFLSQSFDNWSLGKQQDFRPFLSSLKIPVLWIVGSEDQKFKNLGYDIANLNKKILLKEIPKSGHRAPWDNPEIFNDILFDFLK